MAAEVSRDLITRDFLGCAAAAGSKELDLDLKVPSGWVRRLDLLSGETYLEKTASDPAPPRRLHDLNLPPPPASDGSALDLKLLLRPCHRAFDYRSVCTLDKVRSALERESRGRRSPRSDSPSSSSTTTSSSAKKRRSDDREKASSDGSSLMAAGCPGCLMYVLISKGNPRCPRCDSHVPVTVTAVPKKLRIDVNFTT